MLSLGIGAVTKIFNPLFGVISNGIMIFDKLKAIGTFGKIGSVAIKSLMGIVKAIKFIGLAMKAAFLANPVVFIIVAIAAVIAILVVLYKKCAGFRNFVNAMWKVIAKGAISAWNWIKGVAIATWKGIVAYLKWASGIWKSIFNGITAYIKFCINVWKAVFKGILIVAKMVWNGIKVSAVATWNNIKTGIRLVKAVFTGDWNTIKSIALGVWNSIKSGFSGMIEGVKSILSGVVKYFSDKFNEIKSKAQNLPLIGGMFGKNYTGTNYWSGGLTTVAERGPEMIRIPGQSPFIAQSEMLMNLPKGTEILNASRTRNTLRDRVNRIKERASSLGSSGSTVVGGDTINITINAGSNSNANDIAREVKRVLAEMKNKKERVAFG